jgi:hypothetical protein
MMQQDFYPSLFSQEFLLHEWKKEAYLDMCRRLSPIHTTEDTVMLPHYGSEFSETNSNGSDWWEEYEEYVDITQYNNFGIQETYITTNVVQPNLMQYPIVYYYPEPVVCEPQKPIQQDVPKCEVINETTIIPVVEKKMEQVIKSDMGTQHGIQQEREIPKVTMTIKLLRTKADNQGDHIPITDASIIKLINGVRYEINSTVPVYDVKVSYQTAKKKKTGSSQKEYVDENASIEPIGSEGTKFRLHLEHFSTHKTNRTYSFQFLDENGSIVLQTQHFMIYSVHSIKNKPEGFPWADNIVKKERSNKKEPDTKSTTAKKKTTKTTKRKRNVKSSSNKKRKVE